MSHRGFGGGGRPPAMGRGVGRTLPAWMTQNGQEIGSAPTPKPPHGPPPHPPPQPNSNQTTPRMGVPSHSPQNQRFRSRSPARRSRSPARRSRSPAQKSRSPARKSRSPARKSRSHSSRRSRSHSHSRSRRSLSRSPSQSSSRKRRSHKRRHSSSSESQSTSSHTSSRHRHHKRSKHKHRKRSSSPHKSKRRREDERSRSASVSSDSSAASSASSHKKRRHHKHKSSKKHSSKRHGHKHNLPDGVEPLDDVDLETHYWAKHTEFKVWLFNKYKKHFHSLEREDAMRYFKRFVKNWNRGKLDPKIYSGVNSTQLEGALRTAHNWNFSLSKTERMDLDLIRDGVDTKTNYVSKEMQLERDQDADPRAEPNGHNNKKKANDDSDHEGSKRAEQARDRNARKEWQNTIIEETLGPKPTGRDAVIEKRQAQRQAMQDREMSPDVDAMGGNDGPNFKRLLQRQRETQARKSDAAVHRIGELQAKEQARMEEFRRQMNLQ